MIEQVNGQLRQDQVMLPCSRSQISTREATIMKAENTPKKCTCGCDRFLLPEGSEIIAHFCRQEERPSVKGKSVKVWKVTYRNTDGQRIEPICEVESIIKPTAWARNYGVGTHHTFMIEDTGRIMP